MQLYSKVGLAGAIVVVISSVVGFWGFWAFVKYKIRNSATLAPGTDVRKAWERAPIALDFNVYILNLTNPRDVHSGGKPVVREVGPYAFQMWKEKAHIVDHPENDSVSFNMKTTWFFSRERSGALTMDDTVTVPHVVMMGLVYIVEKRKPGSLRVVNRALPAIFDEPDTAFLHASVRDLLFDGVPINCSSRQFAPAALCTAIRGQAANLHKVDDDLFKFSFFGVKNGTPEAGRFTVMRGQRDHRDVGRVALYNHEPRQYVWDGPACNELRGTDSTVFPALRTPSDDLVSFSPDLCRSLGAKYQRTTEYEGLSVYRYTASLGDMSSNPEEKCYCPSPDTCLKKGALDLTECTESPIVVTLPHFYDADPSYLDTVDGLSPDERKHEIFILFEPITGTPLSARKRIQFNMHLHPVKKVALASNLPDAMLPIMWVEEGVDLKGQWIDLLNRDLFRPLFIVSITRWIMISVGLLFVVASVAIWYMVKNDIMTHYFDRPVEAPRNMTRGSAKVMDIGSAEF